MTVTIEVKDEKQLAFVERARGEKSAQEFLQACLQAGLQLVDANMRRAAAEKALQVVGTTDQFKTLALPAIQAALKENNPKNPVVVEINRLVNGYMTQLGGFARQNGDRLPASMTLKTQVPIEQMAFRITADVVKKSIQQQNAPAAAATQKEAAGKKG